MLSLSRCCCCILLLKFINWHPVKCACCCFAWTLNQWIFTYFFTEADSWKLPSTNGFMGFALILWRHDYDVIRRPADGRSLFELTVEFALNVWQVIGVKFCSFSWQKDSFCWLLVSVGLTERTASCCSINLHIFVSTWLLISSLFTDCLKRRHWVVYHLQSSHFSGSPATYYRIISLLRTAAAYAKLA